MRVYGALGVRWLRFTRDDGVARAGVGALERKLGNFGT